jgi:hypothetical protein
MMESLMLVSALAAAGVAIVFLAGTGKSASWNSQLPTLGSALVVLGIVLGGDRFVGYSFIGAGVILSVASVLTNRRGSRIRGGAS